MPIYSFVCDKCFIQEDVYCPHSDKDKIICNKCGNFMREIPTAPEFVIKGFKSKKGLDKNYE